MTAMAKPYTSPHHGTGDARPAGNGTGPRLSRVILRFTPRAAGGPSAVVTLGACPHAYDITVDGTRQPSLWDDGKLRTAAAALAGMR